MADLLVANANEPMPGTACIDCPKAMVGRVIGKGGETIKALYVIPAWLHAPVYSRPPSVSHQITHHITGSSIQAP